VPGVRCWAPRARLPRHEPRVRIFFGFCEDQIRGVQVVYGQKEDTIFPLSFAVSMALADHTCELMAAVLSQGRGGEAL